MLESWREVEDRVEEGGRSIVINRQFHNHCNALVFITRIPSEMGAGNQSYDSFQNTFETLKTSSN